MKRLDLHGNVVAVLPHSPSEYSSGDRRARGHITKRGDARMRWLLVETAWRTLRSLNPQLAGLKAWAHQTQPALACVLPPLREHERVDRERGRDRLHLMPGT